MSITWSAIRYRDLWDVPRIFVTEFRGKWFLFDCPFDDDEEDFADFYKVSLIKPPSEEELAGSWKDFPLRSVQYLGEVPITRLEFDPSRRQAVDAAILDELTTTIGVK